MRSLRRWGLHLLALPVVALLAGVAAPAAGRPQIPIAAGVTIGGLPVGGFTPMEARTLVRERVQAPLELSAGSREISVSADRVGVYPAVDAAIAVALHAEPGDAVPISAAVVSETLDAYVASLDRRLSRPVRDARLVGLDARLRPVLAHEVAGRKLDRTATRAAIEAQLGRAERSSVQLVFRERRPRLTIGAFGPVVVIHRGSNTASVFEHGRLLRVIGVATGQARYPTPLGTFTVADKQYNPWWYPPDSDWARGLKPVPPGPGNPLGTRWMGLSAWGVGMHGTPDAASIGYSASHGCIRMRIPDAEWLFQRVRIGTPVVIVSA
jgi:lipoprotein-anchoring transpeptidase ErfK/SrfK